MEARWPDACPVTLFLLIRTGFPGLPFLPGRQKVEKIACPAGFALQSSLSKRTCSPAALSCCTPRGCAWTPAALPCRALPPVRRRPAGFAIRPQSGRICNLVAHPGCRLAAAIAPRRREKSAQHQFRPLGKPSARRFIPFNGSLCRRRWENSRTSKYL